MRRLADVHDDLTDYLTQPRWYQRQQDLADGASLPNQIAYFSPEFGITEVLPQYSGGLGILAGDHLKAASDLGVPIIGVGLLYGSGYFRQSLSADGWQLEQYPSLDSQGLPIKALPDADGRPGAGVARAAGVAHPVRAGVGGRRSAGCRCCCSTATSRTTTSPRGRSPTGSTAAVPSTGWSRSCCSASAACAPSAPTARSTGAPAPEVFHTNEGHAGFLGIERIRELVEADGLSFDEALQAVRAGTVFTTHTPVPAGIDRFSRDLVAAHLACHAGRAGRADARPRRRGRPDDLQHGAHGAAARPARQRRVACCTARSAGRCSPGCGRASTPTRCRSPR